jgi:hypothetical protein
MNLRRLRTLLLRNVCDVQEDDMLKSENFIYADTRVATAALGAGAIVILAAGLVAFVSTAAPQASDRALGQTWDAQPSNALASNAVPWDQNERFAVIAKGALCSLHTWPNYDQSCLFDRRSPDNRNLRIVDADRE